MRASRPLTGIGAESRPCEQCQHQCENGCGVYTDRPTECKHYQCLYSAGILTGGIEMRPDNLGVLLDWRPAENANGKVVEVIVLWETRPGGLQEPRVKKLIADIRRTMTIRLMCNEFGKVHTDENGRVTKRLL